MIVQTATALRQQLKDYSTLKQNESQLDSIQKTGADLLMVKRDLDNWTRIFPAVQVYLASHQSSEISQQAVNIHRKLGECKVRFENVNRYPQDLLRQLQRAVSQLQGETERAWSQYASSLLAPLKEALRSARQLPALQAKIVQVDPILSSLNEQSLRLPKQPKDIQHFHEQIGTIRNVLNAVPSMTPAQKAFMDRVDQGTATLADLDDHLLQWCKQQGLAPLLKVTKRV